MKVSISCLLLSAEVSNSSPLSGLFRDPSSACLARLRLQLLEAGCCGEIPRSPRPRRRRRPRQLFPPEPAQPKAASLTASLGIDE